LAKILLVEDDQIIAQLVTDSLEVANHTVEHVSDGKEGFERIKHHHYDMAVVDVNLPQMDGFEIISKLRAIRNTTPVLLLTALSEIHNRTKGLDLGADDYLTKPFAVPELLSRVHALLRRPRGMVENTLCAGNLSVDTVSGVATKSGATLSLQPKEYALLIFFMKNPNHLFTARELLERVWSSESEASEEAVRQCILRMRKKIDDDQDSSFIVTVKGIGYKFVP
jgi:DNA-binding response OmpR family regulator